MLWKIFYTLLENKPRRNREEGGEGRGVEERDPKDPESCSENPENKLSQCFVPRDPSTDTRKFLQERSQTEKRQLGRFLFKKITV